MTASLQASRVLSVPAAARRLLRRDRFDLIGTDGEHLGHLALGSGGNAWGLGRYFNRYDPREGEVLVIALDPRLGKALIQHGDRGLVESYQEGVGEGPPPSQMRISTEMARSTLTREWTVGRGSSRFV